MEATEISQKKSKRRKLESLRDRVVDLVKEFVNSEGPLTIEDLQYLFGDSRHGIVARTLFRFPIKIEEKAAP